MSIRLKILLPIILVALGGLALCGLESWLGAAMGEKTADVAATAIRAGELARAANADFDAAATLLDEVTAMTHFVDAAEVKSRYTDRAAAIARDLAEMKAQALSPQMAKLAADAETHFAAWRDDAAAALGVAPAEQIPVADEIRRKSAAVKRALDDALDLSGRDARARIGDISAEQRRLAAIVLGAALVFGAAALSAAWRVARDIAGPIRDLVGAAERLAKGDVSVTFAASQRRDEVGEIARAVAAFRDNVTAAQAAASAVAKERAAAETERRQSEALSAASGQEQARVVDALSQGLERLAAGDLTYRIEPEFSPAYQRLKTNFNHSLDVLQQAMRAIAEGAHDLRSGSSEIAGLAADLSERTGSQTAGIEEAAAALEQITSTVKMTAENADHARGLVSKTRGEAEQSGEVVRTAVEAIGRIQQSSQEIEKIIGVIDEIAFQTSLLALNAGVEAARAGDSGRGFAVVATEVRALAQRSADASKEIKTLISGSSTQVKQGVDLVNSAGAALDRIFAQVSEIDRVVANIANGAAEQSSGLQSVNNGVTQIDRANQSNVAIVDQTTSACSSAADRAERLAEAVARFQVERELAVRRAA